MNFWVPVIFGIFKLGVLCTVIFLSIKSHRDGEREDKRKKELEEQQAAANTLIDAPAFGPKVDE